MIFAVFDVSFAARRS